METQQGKIQYLLSLHIIKTTRIKGTYSLMLCFHLPKLSNLSSKFSLFCLLLLFYNFKDLYYKSQVKTTQNRNSGVEWNGKVGIKLKPFCHGVI